MSNKKKIKQTNSKQHTKLSSQSEQKERFLTKTDYIAMAILTIAFAIMVFVRLGNNYAPTTSKVFSSPSDNEMIIDLGNYMDIAYLDIYLGPYEDRNLALSVFNETTGQWEIIEKEAKVKSVFAWNKIYVGYYTRYLGLVFRDNVADIKEIVCLDPAGNVIRSANADTYPELFDEEAMHPKYSTKMDGTYFDEVYHGRTAYELLHHMTCYENTHPYLGKELISIGIALFGMNPFGWRFMVALLGILMVPVMYIFGKRLTDSTLAATFTCFLLTFDCMHYGLSRIATIDIPVALFILLMYYFMFTYLKKVNQNIGEAATKDFDQAYTKEAYKYLILAGVAMSLAVATKFTGIYAGAGLGLIFIAYTLKHFPKKSWKKLLGICLIFFVALPFVIYTISFIPVVEYVKSPNLLSKMYKCTKDMIDYHANLDATHFYSSKWYTWPYIGKPLLYSFDEMEGNMVSASSLMGNPAIWWPMLPAILYMIFRIFKHKDKTALFLVVSYIAQYLPWMLVSRCLFIYHYFPSAVFGMLIMGYTASIFIKRDKNSKYIIGTYMIIIAIFFMVFYPAISGAPTDNAYLKNLKWLPDWMITLK